jgi:hypothetical protein
MNMGVDIEKILDDLSGLGDARKTPWLRQRLACDGIVSQCRK